MASGNGRRADVWTWDEALRGVVPPLISPLDGTGQPNAGAVDALVAHVIEAGCSGLFVLGGCGEGARLTPSQRGGIIRAAVRAAAGRVPVLAGVMLPATGPVVEAARQAEKAACAVLGLGNGAPAPPLVSLAEDGPARVSALVRRHAGLLAR